MNKTEFRAQPGPSAFRDSDAVLIPTRVELPAPPPEMPPRPPRKGLAQWLAERWASCLAWWEACIVRMRSINRVWVVGAGLAIGALTAGDFACTNIAYYAHNFLGNRCYEEGRWQDSVDEYSQMIDLFPAREDGYELRGMTEWKLHHYSSAIADETRIIALLQGRSNAWDCYRAIAYQSRGYDNDALGRHTLAIADFTKAIALDPTVYDLPNDTANAHDGTADSYKGRLWAYYRNGQYALARLDCNRLIARNPRYADNYAVRGKIDHAAGNLVQAAADFEEAIKTDPYDLLGYEGLSDMQIKAHEYAQALATDQAELRANPTSAIARGNLGWSEYKNGNVKQALATDKAALSQDKSLPWVYDNMGLIYAEEGDWPSAREAYQESLRLAGAEGAAFAVQDVKDALVQHPHSPALLRALEMLQKGV